ncbi:MAG TPA: carbonate dehydratase, partial [Pelagibacterium sp.]|nr:carbonate dehydratase [Pelagibacterium sp.]
MTQQFPPFLIEGYRNFMSGRYATESQRYRKLAEEGQKPTTMVIACCDSRAAPETIF